MALVLIAIRSGGRLEQKAAASWERACNAAGRILRVTSAYRTPEHQLVLYTNWINRVPGYNFATPPAVSAHPKGIAVDTPEYEWMEKNARAFGWIRTDPNERWHYEYRENLDTKKGSGDVGLTREEHAAVADTRALVGLIHSWMLNGKVTQFHTIKQNQAVIINALKELGVKVDAIDLELDGLNTAGLSDEQVALLAHDIAQSLPDNLVSKVLDGLHARLEQ